jgi:uncharacterized radical SAM superfamily protein
MIAIILVIVVTISAFVSGAYAGYNYGHKTNSVVISCLQNENDRLIEENKRLQKKGRFYVISSDGSIKEVKENESNG